LLSVFPAHAPADAAFAKEIGDFLESGFDAVTVAPDAVIKPGRDLISAARLGHSADVLVLLLSPASNPPRWPREVWEPILLRPASETGTHIAVFLLEECAFPPLLRRGLRFFDATRGHLPSMRELKRWVRGIQSGAHARMAFSPDLEILYRVLADKPGTYTAAGEMAERFAHEAAQDFEAVFWIPAHGRTLTQIAGELGARMGMKLDGPVEDNCRRIREVFCGKRCLLIADAPQVSLDPLLAPGRTSVLFTSEAVRIAADERSLPAARALVSGGRIAEAYDLLYELLHAGVSPESCARELIWICEQWDRREEANTLRFHFGPSPSEQLRLF
jgi:hypothetical protein